MTTLVNVTVIVGEGLYTLSCYPWEDVALLVEQAEDILEEMESKPGLGIEWIDEDAEELDSCIIE